MGNLGPPTGDPKDLRPFQTGKVRGKKNNQDVEVSKDWLIDTGSPISWITRENAKNFGPATGGATITKDGRVYSVRRDLKMVFTKTKPDGKTEEVECNLPVAVGAWDIIGMDQLKHVGCAIRWDPRKKDGDIYVPSGDGSGTDNLGPWPGAGAGASPRPFQPGEATGKKNGADVKNNKTWLIDTSRRTSAIKESNSQNFDLTDTHKVAPGSKRKLWSGVTMRFKKRNAEGVDEWVECSLPVTIDNSNIIAMDQLESVGGVIDWDPTRKKGNIQYSLTPAKKKKEKK